MFKNIKNNNKGFTLIELLAVVVIMGILMIVAIPAVTKYIERSRKDAYVDTAKAYINSARYSILNDEYNCSLPTAAGSSVIIPIQYVDGSETKDNVDIDQGGGKSPYNKNLELTKSYIQVTAKSGSGSDGNVKYEYSIAITDSAKNGIPLTSEKELHRSKVDKNVNPTVPTENLCKK